MFQFSSGPNNRPSLLSVRRARALAGVSASALALLVAATGASAQSENEEDGVVLDRVLILSAEDQLKQMPGVSTVTSEDLAKTPVANDISEIIRKMPGANLTGSSASGQRGNQRQIDLRGMGPENTLILIDGKPVLSRNSVRMGRGGERDSRGDSNWVPPEAIERIEVIRGPAAARYGSGAAGGVVNIITKKPDTLSGSVTTYTNIPQHSEEGHTVRGNVVVGGPITDRLSFRLYGSYNRTDGDDADINAEASVNPNNPPAAGREGVTNRDLRGVLTFEADGQNAFDIEASYSRQGNIFAGDSQNSATGANFDRLQSLVGEETNVLKRSTLSATHRGEYDFAESNSFIQWERTRNTRLAETLAGGSEGSIAADLSNKTIELDTVTAKSEWILPIEAMFDQKLTLGVEYRGEWMHDPVSADQPGSSSISYPVVPSIPRELDPDSSDWLVGLYAEDNISITDDFTLTPGLRFDHHSTFGSNLSPSLNASYTLTDTITLKAGIARAFKAPNLFQQNPEYILYSRGGGCAVSLSQGCYIIGNENLKPETSINKEIGISYHDDLGWNAGITYFHNDYRNRISTGTTPVGSLSTTTVNVYQWENTPEAVVQGLEGNLSVPLHEQLTWSTNFTYMIESKNKQTGQPLTLVPDYTINTSLDWQAREDLSVVLSATHYGETPSPTIRSFDLSTVTNPEPRDPYTLVNIGLKYDVNEHYQVSAGVNNVFDKRVFREGSGNAAGANTYNEAGRSFYVSLTGKF
jgi:ferric enterobactin receptor